VVDTAQTGGASAAQTGGASAAEADGAAADSDGATTRSESASVPASATAAAMRSCSAQSRGGPPVSGAGAQPITALSPRRYKIEITVDEETHDKLRSLQDLLGRSQVGRDPAAIISRAIDVLLVDSLKRKAATTDQPRPRPSARGGASRENPVRRT